ncbi:PIN2/TERF1-interacting telomerase inhibitor 1 isoform X2 [Nannospalax galili]|nr:PIN2/TERF1-interacting telomerase inhibitor 1 isoform X2 [Nannospalax galili]
MLEKMGWSKGKGLGAQEQGATEHIKVQVKNNHLGLGASNNNEDNWIAHQDDFNQLLAALNTCHGQEKTDSSDNKEKKSFSLEEKSRISKNRVHYMKFTKGKDLSSRSKTDLDCIFGKRGSKKAAQDDCSPSAVNEPETSTTTTSAFTIQEYFAKRMAQLKSKPQAPAAGPDLSETLVEWEKGKKKTKEAAGIDMENCPQSKAKQPKKKKQEEVENQGPAAKKRDRAEQQPQGPSENQCSDASAETERDYAPDSQDGALKPKKKEAKKKLQKPGEVAADTALDGAPVKTKKTKKKKASR